MMCCSEVVRLEPAMEGLADAEPVHVSLEAEPRAARSARAFVRQSVDVDDEDFVSDVVLLTSELVTNAVIHARTPIEIGVVRSGDHVLVAVGDRNLARPEQQPYSIGRTSGRGLRILQAFTDAWGVTTHDRGKSVWFTMHRKSGTTGGAR